MFKSKQKKVEDRCLKLETDVLLLQKGEVDRGELKDLYLKSLRTICDEFRKQLTMPQPYDHELRDLVDLHKSVLETFGNELESLKSQIEKLSGDKQPAPEPKAVPKTLQQERKHRFPTVKLLNVRQVAKMAKVTVNSVYVNSRNGRLKYVPTKQGKRFHEKEVKRWIEAKKKRKRP